MTLKILIVDDRANVRERLRELIELSLNQDADIEVDDIFPLDAIGDYASYILENDVAALLLDERLNESQNPLTGTHIAYLGHEVVDSLRSSLPDFPIYVVTTFRTDSDLVAKESDFEDVVERSEFLKDIEKYTSRIQRAASRFWDSMRQQLNTLEALTTKAAHGNLNEAERRQLVAVREALALPFSADSQFVASDLIAQARELAIDSERLIRKIEGT